MLNGTEFRIESCTLTDWQGHSGQKEICFTSFNFNVLYDTADFVAFQRFSLFYYNSDGT